MQMPAGEFKAKCLKLMDLVNKKHEEVIITKRGKPVARLVPIQEGEPEKKSIFGCLEGTVLKYEDPLEPVGLEDWEELP